MALQYKFFIVPVRELQETESEVNRFLRTVCVINVQREFVNQGDNSFWSMAVEYITGDADKSVSGSDSRRKSKIDYKEVLSPEDFTIYVKLREWRKEVAIEESVPVYAIFTNEQLAIIAEKKIVTIPGLQEIDGVGESRIKKYGEAVIKIVAQEHQGKEQKPEE